MQNLTLGKLDKLVVHFVGNKTNGDGVRFSNILIQFEKIDGYIKQLVSNNFKLDELYCFYFHPNLDLNPMFQFVSSIFEDLNLFVEQSQNSARYLYDKSINPRVKAGELCFSYFKNCEFNGENVDCIGIFKSENKETILKISPVSEGFELNDEKGINIHKLDKGCLIFNTEKDSGYVVAVVDNTNKGIEAQYWIDDFLHVRSRKDEYYNTQNILSIYKNFVKNELPQQFEISKADQADLINKSVRFFKEKDAFDINEFANQVIGEKSMIDSFNMFKNDYQKEREIEISDNFQISESAVKKNSRSLKGIIKLDKNFDIHIHGNRDLIEHGIDEKGKYYKVYYTEET